MDVFDDWNDRFPRGGGTDHQLGPLTEDSVFMRQGVTAPRPAVSYWSAWSWYENALQLRGHLSFVVLPDMAALWLNEGSVGLNTPRLTLTETISSASSANQTDVDFFAGLAHDLETASAATNHELALKLEALAIAFTERFGRTPTWDLFIEIFPSDAAAGSFLFDEDPDGFNTSDGTEMSREEWLRLCERALTDAEASRIVEETLQASFCL